MAERKSFQHDGIPGWEFEDMNMAGTQFTNINLSGSRFQDINFSDVLFTAAQIGGTTFRHIGPPPCKVGGQERQRPVTFEWGTLCDSTFRKMDLTNVRIMDCDLSGMTIDGILVTDLLRELRKRND